MDNGDAITAGLGATLAAILGTAGYGLRNIVAAWFKKLEGRIAAPPKPVKPLDFTVGVRGLKKVIAFWEILEAASELPFVDRILIFSGMNCGGTPAPGKAYNVSCNWAYCANKEKHPERLYVGPLRVDSHYVKMLLEMIENRSIQLTTAEMHPGSMLRSYYEAEGVVQSRLYFLSFDSDGRELLFCTVANYARVFGGFESVQIDMVVDRLRGLMGESTDSEVPVLKK